MKIILYKDVQDLGEEGDVKEVADGYARNFLIPKKLAVRYSKTTEVELTQKQQAISRRKEEKAKMAASDKEKIKSLEMEIAVAAGDKGKLFGSITSSAIVDYLNSQGIDIDRKRIEIPSNGLKVLGTHTVTVKLYGGEKASLKINITALGSKKDEEEISTEKETEKPLKSSDEEQDVEDSSESEEGTTP